MRPTVVAGIVVAAVVALTGLHTIRTLGESVTQPVAFNHKAHIDAEIDCAGCHTGALEGTRAGLPTIDRCLLCHTSKSTYPKTPGVLALYLQMRQEIPWRVVHKIRRHVHFSHERHVRLGGIDCAECHGDVKKMTQPFTRAVFPGRQPGMNRCVACHRKERVSTDCVMCHR